MYRKQKEAQTFPWDQEGFSIYPVNHIYSNRRRIDIEPQLKQRLGIGRRFEDVVIIVIIINAMNHIS